MPKTSKAWLAMAAMVTVLSAGALSSVVAQAEEGPPEVTSTTSEGTTAESTSEEESELPTQDSTEIASLRKQIRHNRVQTWRWETYAFTPRSKTRYMESHSGDMDQLRRLLKWWRGEHQKARKYALSFRYADRYLPPLQARIVGQRMAAKFYHWTGQQWQCLDTLWGHTRDGGTLESGWYAKADNSTSDAHGIPQALPGKKMGPGWWDNVFVQIKWGLRYVLGRYGIPCGALNYRLAAGGY